MMVKAKSKPVKKTKKTKAKPKTTEVKSTKKSSSKQKLKKPAESKETSNESLFARLVNLEAKIAELEK